MPIEEQPHELRDYQRYAVRSALASLKRHVLIVAPTGAGKGTMATDLLARAAQEQKRAVFVVHRREIVKDVVQRLRTRGVVAAETLLSNKLVRVVSVQGAISSASTQAIDLLVIDEAHHYVAEEWRQVVEKFRARKVIGFTATPERRDGKSLGDIFDQLITAIDYGELIERRIIVGCRVLRPREVLDGALAKDPAVAYALHGAERRALMFVNRVSAAEATTAKLRDLGVSAAAVHGETPLRERDELLARFRAGDLRVLVNVNVLTEGVDLPDASCVVLARPCQHASTYLQIVGRVLRAAPGKRGALLIDLVGASHVHGMPCEDREYSLGPEPIRTKQPHVEREIVESRSLSVLDLELESVEHRERKREATPARPLPERRTHGFIFPDRGFYQLRWREFGKKRQVGLCTRDENRAQELHQLFIAQGEAALRETVIKAKRNRCCLVWHKSDGMFYGDKWNDDRTQEIRVKLYTAHRGAAEELAELFKTGRDSDAYTQIEENRRAFRGHLRGSSPPGLPGSRPLGGQKTE